MARLLIVDDEKNIRSNLAAFFQSIGHDAQSAESGRQARAMIEADNVKRVGLLATQGIRGGPNRTILKRIKESGDIFWAQSDRDWVLDGANVHVSMVGFDGGGDTERVLDGDLDEFIEAYLRHKAIASKELGMT